MIRRLLAAGALSCVLAAPAFAQQTDDVAYGPTGTYRLTQPTEAINPACQNAGPGGIGPGPGVVGKTYGGTVCPPAGGASTVTATLGAFAPTGQVALSATTTSSNVALGSVGPTAVITNGGSSTAYITFGGAGVTANTSGYPVPAGWVVALSNGSNTYVAALSASGTDALTITTGVGLPAFAAPGSGGGGGGAVSAAVTSYAAGFSPDIGTSSDGPCSSDTATCDLLSRVARTNQNITTLINLLKSPGPGATNLGISGSAFALLTQGTGAADANSLRVASTIYFGGSVLSLTNGLPVNPATGSLWGLSAAANAFADGSDITQGAKGDAPCAASTSSCSEEARLADLEAQITAVKVASQSTATIPMGCAQIGSTSGTAANCNVSTPDVNVVGTVVAATSTSNAFVVQGGNGQALADVTISGLTTSTATLTPQYEGADNSTWTNTSTEPSSNALGQTTVTADGTYTLLLSGHRAVRLLVTTAGTGSITFNSNSSTAGKEVRVGGVLPGFAAPPAVTVNGGAISVVSSTSGGSTGYHYSSAATANPVLVSTGAHTLYFLGATNTSTTALACLHLYNTAITPTAGATGATLLHTFAVSEAASAGLAGGFMAGSIGGASGESYPLGLAFTLTGGASGVCTDSDTSSAPAGVNIELSYR